MKLILTFFLVIASTLAFSQVEVAKNIKDFSIDALGNCYAIRNNEIIKINRDGKIVSNNSRRDQGIPTAIDAIDPLRILVLFKDFGIISRYDNFLGSQPDIDLRQFGIFDAQLIAGTNDGGVWIFDRATNQLFKINPELNKNLLTIDLRQILYKEIAPKMIRISANWMVLQSEKEVFVFDQFGTYIRTLPIENKPTVFQLNENELIMGDSTIITSQKLNLISPPAKLEISLPTNHVKSVITDDIIWSLLGNTQLIRQNKK
jgi:hypothetical protein